MILADLLSRKPQLREPTAPDLAGTRSWLNGHMYKSAGFIEVAGSRVRVTQTVDRYGDPVGQKRYSYVDQNGRERVAVGKAPTKADVAGRSTPRRGDTLFSSSVNSGRTGTRRLF